MVHIQLCVCVILNQVHVGCAIEGKPTVQALFQTSC